MEEEFKDCPPGTKKMTESDRQAMLSELYGSKANLQSILDKMPISMRTMALEKKKTELIQKIEEVEGSIKIFSKPVVYIAM